MLELTLLGEVSLRSDGINVRVPNSKAYALLAYMLLERSEVTIPDLADLFWPDSDISKARHSISQLIYGFRRATSQSQLITRIGDNLTLNRDVIACDAVELDRLAKSGDLLGAVKLYGGELLHGLEIAADERFEHWRDRAAARVNAVYARCLEALCRKSSMDDAPAVEEWTRTVLSTTRRPDIAHLYYRAVAEQHRLFEAEVGLAGFIEDHRSEFDPEDVGELTRLLRSIADAKAVEHENGDGVGSTRTRFIGRDHEVAALKQAWREAVEADLSALVLTGDPGIGKTRLLEQLARYAAIRGARVVHIVGSPATQRVPLYAAESLLRQLHPVGDPDAGAARVGTTKLYSEAGNDVDPAAPTRSIYLQAQHLIGSACAQNPLLVMIDDLQWVDDSSLELLVYLGYVNKDRQLLLAATARPEAADAIFRIREGCRTVVQAIEPLPPSVAEQLLTVHSAMRGRVLERDEAAWVLSRSGGNPFYILALSAAHRDLGIAAPSLSGLPDTVTALILSRVRQLTSPAHDVIRVISITRSPESIDTLAAIAGASEMRTARGVEELVRFRLATDVDGKVVSSHDLIADVVYAAIPQSIVQLLHRRAADVIGSRASALEAHHAWRGCDLERASRAAAHAAAEALSVRAYSEAEFYFQMAIDGAPTEHERARASAEYVNFAHGIESPELALKHVALAKNHFVNSSDDVGLLRCSAIELDCSLRTGSQSLSSAASAADLLMARAEELGDPDLAAEIASVSWRVAELSADPEMIRVWVERALSIADQCSDAWKVSLVGRAAVLGYAVLGAEWTDHVSAQLTTSEPEDPRLQALSLAYRGAALMLIGKLVEAERCYLSALDIAEDPVLADTFVKANWNLAVLDMDMGRYESARKRFNTKLGGMSGRTIYGARLVRLVNMGYLGIECEDLELSDWAVAELRTPPQLEAPVVTAAAAAIAGLAAWARGDFDKARREAAALYDSLQPAPLLSDDSYAWMLLGRVHARDNIRRALEMLDSALLMKRPAVPQLRVELERAIHARAVDPVDSRTALHDLANRAEAMGAMPLARRARAALGAGVLA